MDGKEGALARKGMSSPFQLGKHGINIKDLEELGVKAIVILKQMLRPAMYH